MSTGYLKWNDLLGEVFFKPEFEGKSITLVISPEDVISIGRNAQLEGLEGKTDLEIVEDFRQAWRAGHPGMSGNIIEKIILEDKRGMAFYSRGWDNYQCDGLTVRYPPALMHLAGIIMAIIEGTDQSRYKRIQQYFSVTGARFPNMSEHLNWNAAWENLIWWANTYKKGSLGRLPGKSLSTEKFEYMGKPYTFVMLSRKQLNLYYQYFFENDIEPQTSINNNDLLLAFKKVRGNDNLFRILAGDTGDEDKQLVFTILRQLYHAWDGSFVKQVDSSNIKISYLSRKLKLSFETDDDGYVKFSFRFKEDLFTSSQIQFEEYLVSFSSNQWSTPIPIKIIPDQKIFSEDALGLKLVFKPAENQLFVFVNGRIEGLNSQTWVESDHILYGANQFILLKKQLYGRLGNWIEDNAGVNISQDWLRPADLATWQLFQFEQGFSSSFDDYGKLTMPVTEALTIQSGLRGVARGEFIIGFPVIANLDGARGTEILQLTGPGRYEYPIEDGQIFKITGDLIPGDYEISIINKIQEVGLPNNGRISFSRMTSIGDVLESLDSIQAFPDENNIESQLYKQSVAVVNNNLFQYPVAPQFNLWAPDFLTPEELDQRTIASVHLLEYILTKGSLSKMAFEQALSVIKSNSGGAEEFDFYQVSKYTLNGLKEGSRVILEFLSSGSVGTVHAVKPWIFRLGNYQNFPIPFIKAGLQPFKGSLYALGGTYSMDLLKQLSQTCKDNGAALKMYREGSASALVPPTVFIYSENNHFPVDRLKAALDQEEILPYYRYLTPHVTLPGKIEEFKQGRMWDLHSSSRYQYFDTGSFLFKAGPGGKLAEPPSLSLYTVQAWEKYHILRFEQDGKIYQGQIDPRWGKYILLFLKGMDSLFCFDGETNTLYIPAALRLPAGIEDNLFFLTGRMPAAVRLRDVNNNFEWSSHNRAGRTYLAYKGILMSTAAAIAESVGQQLIAKTVLNHDRSV